MVRSLTRRGMPKPFAIALAALLALYFVPLGALPAHAADVGGFEIEGNLSDDSSADPPIDWSDLGPGAEGFSTGVDNTTASGQDTTTFQGSSKEYDTSGNGAWPRWTFGSGNAAGKSDFGRWATYDFVDSSDHVWLFLGFDRGSGTGTSKYVFELNQVAQDVSTNPNPVRSQGDVRLVVWDQGNGVVTLTPDSRNSDVGLYKWRDPDQAASGVAEDIDKDGAWVKSSQAGIFAGASNTGESPIPVPVWWTSGNVSDGKLATDQFLEFGIDLTSFGAVLDCPSAGFTTLNARSITGTGGPGTLVDYLQAIPITIPSNCAALQINKFGPGQERLGGATFKISPNPLPVGTPGRPNADHITIFDDSDDNNALNGGTYDDPDARAGYIVLPVVVPDVEYTVTEVSPPAGYIGEIGSRKTTPVAFGSGSVSFTNGLGSVQFFKAYAGGLVGDAGASFRLTRDGDGDGDYGDEPDSEKLLVVDNGTNDAKDAFGVIKVKDLKTGDYRLVEVDAPTGYAKDADAVYFSIPGVDSSADVVLANPTFENPRKTYPLEVRKVGVTPGSADVPVEGAVFQLWRDTDGSTGPQSTDTIAGTCTTGSDGRCSVGDQPWGHDYYWEELSVPAPWNLPDTKIIGPVRLSADGSTNPSGATKFSDPRSAIVTQATNGSLPGATISDTATLSGVNKHAEGAVTFDLYFTGGSEPTEDSCTDGSLVQAGIPATETVDGPGQYSTGPVLVSNAGYYAWVAHYSGDQKGNRPVSGACDDEGETSIVTPAKPGITTVVPQSEVHLGDTPTFLTDTAFLSGTTANAKGAVTFSLYGDFDGSPDADSCETDDLIKTVASVEAFHGDGRYTSLAVEVTEAGYYTWVATYDSTTADNEDATHACGQESETVHVKQAQPSITTEAEQSAVALSAGKTSLTDKATLSGATADAKGSITFSLYGPFRSQPGATSCDDSGEDSNLVATVGSVEAFSGNGTYTSQPVQVTLAGYYTWVAEYDSDSNNRDATHPCGQEIETTLVEKAQPSITTEVPLRAVTLGPDGSDLTDTATLADATATPVAGGTVTFTLYGPFATVPGAQSCEVPLEAEHNPQVVDVDKGNGSHATPDAVRVTQAGYYTWIATYSGDANNRSATHACGLASETVHVMPRQPVVSTQISATALVLGGQGSVSFSDQATLSEATNTAGGTITFGLFGPGATVEAACATTGAVQGAAVAVTGNGTYQGPTVSVSAPGYYSWVATYSGDANNLAASHACGLPSETVRVFSGPGPTLEKVADPPTGSVVQRGQVVTYTVTVGNTGDVAIDDGVVTDTLPAYVTVDQASVTASGGSFTVGGDRTKSSGTIKWTVDLAPGQTTSFTYKVTVDADAPELATLVNLVEFFGIQRTTTHRVPGGDLAIVKEVTPVAGNGVVVEFGDTLTYTLTVTALGQQNQTNVVVTDYLPGSDPDRPESGTTTYVAGSATCDGTCTVAGPGPDGLITWSLGSMAAGTARQVTFQVVIDEVTGAPGTVVAVDILNAGAVASTETPRTPSNEVVTPVTAVFPVKEGQPPAPAPLPRTGAAADPAVLAMSALGLLGLGLLLVAAARRRQPAPRKVG